MKLATFASAETYPESTKTDQVMTTFWTAIASFSYPLVRVRLELRRTPSTSYLIAAMQFAPKVL